MQTKNMNANILINLLICLFFFSLVSIFASPVYAQNQFSDGLSNAEQNQLNEILSPINKFISATRIIAVSIAALFLAIAGVLFIIGRGDPAQKERAKQMVTYVVIGLGVIVIAPAVVQFVIL